MVQAQLTGAFITWEELSKAFRNKYFPPSGSAKLRNKILGFQQSDGESLYEAWQKYKELLRKCHNHQLPKWVQVQTLYNRLQPNTQAMVNIAGGGVIYYKTLEEANKIMDTLASN